MSRLTVWLVRHGEVQTNAGLWSLNPAETHLTVRGRKQAAQSAEQVIEKPDLFMVSPLIRAKETMQYFINRWPETPLWVMPIHEFMYLSPKRLGGLDPTERKEEKDAFWRKNDPYYCDGEEAESFASFLQRVAFFHQHIIQQQGYVVVVGHGQFFKAFQLGLHYGFTLNPEWMHVFRKKESASPIKNGEIIQICFN